MIKYYCDNCGVEVTDENRNKDFTVQVADIAYRVERVMPVPEYSATCKHCVLDAVASTDDRPRAA